LIPPQALTASFIFDVDDAPVAPSGPMIPWEEARLMILAAEVEQVTQLHSLKVTLPPCSKGSATATIPGSSPARRAP
jgi:hypothetical protein